MKRAAIQLFGHLRSFKYTSCYFINNLIKPLEKEGYKVDIFIHSWNETDTSEKSWHNLEADKRGRFVNDSDIEFIKNKYKPIDFILEKQLEIKDDFEFQERFMNMPRQYAAIVNSAYTKYKVNELRKCYEKNSGVEYDYVIQTRPDIQFVKQFGIDLFLQTYKNYNLQIPENTIFTTSVPFRRGNIESDIFLCSIDLILFAKPDVINKINYFYKDIEKGNIDKKWILDNCYSLEILWLKYWQKLNLDIARLKYFQFGDYDIVRNIAEYEKIPKLKDASILKIQESRKNKRRKILKEILKLFPYWFAYKKIKKLDEKINRSF